MTSHGGALFPFQFFFGWVLCEDLWIVSLSVRLSFCERAIVADVIIICHTLCFFCRLSNIGVVRRQSHCFEQVNSKDKLTHVAIISYQHTDYIWQFSADWTVILAVDRISTPITLPSIHCALSGNLFRVTFPCVDLENIKIAFILLSCLFSTFWFCEIVYMT